MRTKSDRRLESNLLAGLELIILERLPDDAAAFRAVAVPSCDNPTYKRVDRLHKYTTNAMIARVMGTTAPGEIATLRDEDLIGKGFLPSETLYQAIGDGWLLRVAKLFGRLGWEAGRCIAAVHRCGYDWGTYQDHSSDGMLANAHANNLVILPPDLMDLGGGRFQLLYPTDFDMSFTRRQAVDVWKVPPVPDPEFVDQMFSVELSNMMMNIGGYTAALVGVATGISKRDPVRWSARMDIIWAFRDISVWEYIKGYLRPADPGYPGNDITLEQALEFIPEAPNRTIDIVV
jgi:hypothetical protein